MKYYGNGCISWFLPIGSSCLLEASSLIPSTTNLEVTGSDGVHNVVTSRVTVRVSQYNNQSLNDAVVLRLTDITPETFVKDSYSRLLQSLNKLGVGKDTILLSLRPTGESDLDFDVDCLMKSAFGTCLCLTKYNL